MWGLSAGGWCGGALVRRVRSVHRSRPSPDRSDGRLVGRLGPLDSTAPAQVAFAIPKRHVKKATDRNRIRRLMREAYRLEKERWYGPLRAAGVQCAWLVIYQSSQPLAFTEMRQRLCGLADRWLSMNLKSAPDPSAPSPREREEG